MRNLFIDRCLLGPFAAVSLFLLLAGCAPQPKRTFFCGPNGHTYDTISACTADCHASLKAFVGICIPGKTQPRKKPHYSMNGIPWPLLMAGLRAAALAAALVFAPFVLTAVGAALLGPLIGWEALSVTTAVTAAEMGAEALFEAGTELAADAVGDAALDAGADALAEAAQAETMEGLSFEEQVEKAVIEEMRDRTGGEFAESWELRSLEGPKSMSDNLDPTIGESQVRYQASFWDSMNEELLDISVNFDPATGQFGIIKFSGGG